MTLSTVARWRIASALLAAVAGYALLFRGASPDTPASQAATTVRDGAIPMQLRRPLRISAANAGISTTELVDRMFAAKTAKDVALLAEKLGVVGDDAAVDATQPLLADPRRGVPEAVLAAYGQIGTEHAVAVLVERSKDDRPLVRNAAIAALGSTQSKEAEKLLVEIAQKPGDPAQGSAIIALGRLGTDGAVEVLSQIANNTDYSAASSAVSALATATQNPAAGDALLQLMGSPDTRIAAQALQSIDGVDAAMLDKLATIVKTGDQQLASAALTALGKAGEPALPVLKEAALRGSRHVRWAAVGAIAQVGGPKAITLLGEILKTGDRQAASQAASALANLGGKEARAMLIEVALSDRGQISGALAQLAQLDGDDVDAALLKVIKEGSDADRAAALPRLLKSGNEDALRVAIDLANKGGRQERYEAIRLLADSGSPKAWDALVEIAGKGHGNYRMQALQMLVHQRPGDPAVEALLSDSLFSGRKQEAQYAAMVLGQVGTEQSRQLLLTALSGKDKELATSVVMALGNGGGMSDQVKQAMLTASRDNPQIKLMVTHQLIDAGDPQGLRLAEEMLGSKKPGPQAQQVLWALASVGSADAKKLIDRALDSQDSGVRIAAISTLMNNPDDKSTDKLVTLARDNDQQVRSTAINTLAQIGSEKAQNAIIDATRAGKAEDRMAAINGLASMDDPRASQALANLMRDSDPQVAQHAIGMSYQGGPEVDQTLSSIVNDGNAKAELRNAAAQQLRMRGNELDAGTEKSVTQLIGAKEAGGAGYGGYYGKYLE